MRRARAAVFAALLALHTVPAGADEAPPSQSAPEAEPATNHPRLYFTPAGPSAYSLDRGEWEIQLLGWDAFPYYLQLEEAPVQVSLAQVRVGVLPGLTVEVGGGFPFAQAGLRWSFLSWEGWTFALQATGADQVASWTSSPGSLNQDEVLTTASLLASHEFDPDNHLHVVLSAGYTHSDRVIELLGVYAGPTLESHDAYADYGLRASVELEHRFNYRHGVSLWAAANAIRSNLTSDQTYLSYEAQNDFSALGGVGYHYVRQVFWTMVGLELGPNSTQAITPYGIDTFRNVVGNLVLTLGWRI